MCGDRFGALKGEGHLALSWRAAGASRPLAAADRSVKCEIIFHPIDLRWNLAFRWAAAGKQWPGRRAPAPATGLS